MFNCCVWSPTGLVRSSIPSKLTGFSKYRYLIISAANVPLYNCKPASVPSFYPQTLKLVLKTGLKQMFRTTILL